MLEEIKDALSNYHRKIMHLKNIWWKIREMAEVSWNKLMCPGTDIEDWKLIY